jgi:hypothetical protein
MREKLAINRHEHWPEWPHEVTLVAGLGARFSSTQGRVDLDLLRSELGDNHIRIALFGIQRIAKLPDPFQQVIHVRSLQTLGRRLQLLQPLGSGFKLRAMGPTGRQIFELP